MTASLACVGGEDGSQSEGSEGSDGTPAGKQKPGLRDGKYA